MHPAIVNQILAKWSQFSGAQRQAFELLFGLNGRTALSVPDTASYLQITVDDLVTMLASAIPLVGLDVSQTVPASP